MGSTFVGSRVAPSVGVVSHAGSIFVFECGPGFLPFRKSNTNGPILGGLSLAARLVEFSNKDIIFLDLLQEANFAKNSRGMFH